MIVYVNGKYFEENEATLGIGDLAIQRGYGVFDYFRSVNKVPLFLPDYLSRFFNSAAGLGLKLQVLKEELVEAIDELTSKNGIPEAGFRMILTGGYSPDSFQPTAGNLIIIQQPLQVPSRQKFDQGITIITSEYKRDLPSIKSINYLMGIYLLPAVQQQQADEVLYCHNDQILEFPRSNVFVVTKDKKLITPKNDVLHGITRMKVLEIARSMYQVEEREVTVEELLAASEVFLTSTTKRIMPVVAVNKNPVGTGQPGEVTKTLYEAFLEKERTYICAAPST